MADNLTLKNDDSTTVGTLAMDEIGGVLYARSKVGWGADGSYNDASAANPLPITDESIVVCGTATYSEATSQANLIAAVRNDTLAALADTDNEMAPLQVNASGALYVDGSDSTQPVNWNGTAPPIGAGVEATALRVTLATDSTGLVSVDDNGGSLTIDNSDITTIAGAVSGSEMQVDIVSGGPTQYAVDAALGSTPTGNLAVAIRDDALSSLTPVEGDAVGMRVDANGALWVIPSGDVSIDDGGNAITVDWAGTAPPIGAGTESTALRVTLATDSTGLVSVDDNGGALTVDAANDGSLNVTIGDGSATATVRDLASNDALNVAIVDASGNQVTSFGGSGGTSATDDSTFTAASGSGTPIMGFATSDSVNSGDVGVLAMDTSRNLKVSIEADNAGIGGGTQYTEDAAAPANPVGNALMGERDDALGGLTPAEGDWTHLYVNANGALWTKHDGDITIADGGNVISVDDGGSTLSIDDGGGDISIDWGGTAPPIGAGVEATALRVTVATNSTGVLSVDDNGTTLSVDDGGGALTVDGTVSISGTVTVDPGSNNDVQGAVAHDSAVTGNPFLAAGEARSSEGTAVANGDAARLIADLVGKLVTSPYAPSDLLVNGTANATGTSNTSIIAAQGAGVRIYITSIQIANASATASEVILKDGTTEVMRVPAPANGGAVFSLPAPLQLTANTAFQFASADAVTTMYVSAQGYTGR